MNSLHLQLRGPVCPIRVSFLYWNGSNATLTKIANKINDVIDLSYCMCENIMHENERMMTSYFGALTIRSLNNLVP